MTFFEETSVSPANSAIACEKTTAAVKAIFVLIRYDLGPPLVCGHYLQASISPIISTNTILWCHRVLSGMGGTWGRGDVGTSGRRVVGSSGRGSWRRRDVR